jgi:hypothetical protein
VPLVEGHSAILCGLTPVGRLLTQPSRRREAWSMGWVLGVLALGVLLLGRLTARRAAAAESVVAVSKP